MPALLNVLRFGKIRQTPFRAQTRRFCALFPKHGLSVNAIHIITLAMGVAVSKVFFRLCDIDYKINNFQRFFYIGQWGGSHCLKKWWLLFFYYSLPEGGKYFWPDLKRETWDLKLLLASFARQTSRHSIDSQVYISQERPEKNLHYLRIWLFQNH